MVESDHNILSCEFNFAVKPQREEKREVFNIRNKDNLKVFKNITENDKEFTKCFEDDLDIKEQGKKWSKILRNKIRKAFKKVRVKKSKRMETKNKIDKMIEERKLLVSDRNILLKIRLKVLRSKSQMKWGRNIQKKSKIICQV